MAHIRVPEAEAILDQEFPVLDLGFVRLVDYMGGDAAIVEAARVSYGEGTKTKREDKGLIDYLLRNKHTSPFEQVEFKFHVKMPIFVARQWVRHRMASLNEVSGRYSVMKDEFYLPTPDAIHFQSKDNKQGRSDVEVPEALRKRVLDLLKVEQGAAYGGYQALIEHDVARELARINLPVSLYTEMYWKIDLHNLMHFLRLRMDGHAQYEIRVYGEVMAKMVEAVAPMAFEAFEEHILYGQSFSKTEMDALSAVLENEGARKELNTILANAGLRKSRRDEFFKKLGLEAPSNSPQDLQQTPLFGSANSKPATAAD